MDQVTTAVRRRGLTTTVTKNTAIARNTKAVDNQKTVTGLKQQVARGGISKASRGAFAELTNQKQSTVRQTSSKTAANAAAAFIGTLKPETAVQTTNANTNRRVRAASRAAQSKKPTASQEPPQQAPPQQEEKVEQEQRVYVPAQLPETCVHPLDIKDMENHLMAGEYAPEIFAYMREMEMKLMPKPDYMDRQPEIEWKFRRTLVDWMISIHDKFGLHPETLFLAVNIVDRFLSARQCSAEALQAVAVSALLIASKYEEQYTPPLQQFVMMTSGACSDKMVLRWERTILYVLEFELGWPSPTHFLRRVSKAENYTVETRTLAKFFLEIGLMDERLLAYPPSKIAAASLWIARRICQKGSWTADLQYFSGYANEEMVKCAQKLIAYLEENMPFSSSKLQAVFKKYSKDQFMRASIVVENWMRQEIQKLRNGHAAARRQ